MRYERIEVSAEDVRVGDLIEDLRSWSHVDSVDRYPARPGGIPPIILIVHRYQKTYDPFDTVQVLRPEEPK